MISATRATDHTTSRSSTQSTRHRVLPRSRMFDSPGRGAAPAHSWLDKPVVASYHAAISPPRSECGRLWHVPLMNPRGMVKSCVRILLRRIPAPCAHLLGGLRRGAHGCGNPMMIQLHDRTEHLLAFLAD